MKVLRIYTGADDRSHLEETDVPCAIPTPYGPMSEPFAAREVLFRETAADYAVDFHCAPQRQLVVVLSGALEIEVGDGTRARVNAGEIILGEDTTGEGHITRAVGGAGRSLLIPLA